MDIKKDGVAVRIHKPVYELIKATSQKTGVPVGVVASATIQFRANDLTNIDKFMKIMSKYQSLKKEGE